MCYKKHSNGYHEIDWDPGTVIPLKHEPVNFERSHDTGYSFMDSGTFISGQKDKNEAPDSKKRRKHVFCLPTHSGSEKQYRSKSKELHSRKPCG